MVQRVQKRVGCVHLEVCQLAGVKGHALYFGTATGTDSTLSVYRLPHTTLRMEDVCQTACMHVNPNIMNHPDRSYGSCRGRYLDAALWASAGGRLILFINSGTVICVEPCPFTRKIVFGDGVPAYGVA